MKKNIFFIILLFFVILNFKVSANQGSSFVILRSGVVENDDIEEPLNDKVLRYKAYLDTSNQIVEKLSNGFLEDVYNYNFSQYLKSNFNKKQFSDLFKEVQDEAGRIISYKKMQWQFIFFDDEDKNIICIKIVHHEKAVFYYRFLFDVKNELKLVGILFEKK